MKILMYIVHYNKERKKEIKKYKKIIFTLNIFYIYFIFKSSKTTTFDYFIKVYMIHNNLLW